MELLRLRYFVALAESENLTQTASNLHISASSLSLTIAKLEKELGTKLFDRVGRKLQLNETGKEFLFHIRNSLTELDLAVSKARQIDTISILTDSPTAWTTVLSEFADLKPGIHISNRNVKRNSIGREISLDDYDFWLTSANPSDFTDGLKEHLLMSPKLFLAVPETNELAKKGEVSFDDIKGENFLFPFSTYPLYSTYMNACLEQNFEPHIISNCGFFVRMQMISSGLGVSFVDGDMQQGDLLKGIVFLKISDAPVLPPRRICWRKGRKLSPSAKEFLKFITLYYKDV